MNSVLDNVVEKSLCLNEQLIQENEDLKKLNHLKSELIELLTKQKKELEEELEETEYQLNSLRLNYFQKQGMQ